MSSTAVKAEDVARSDTQAQRRGRPPTAKDCRAGYGAEQSRQRHNFKKLLSCVCAMWAQQLFQRTDLLKT